MFKIGQENKIKFIQVNIGKISPLAQIELDLKCRDSQIDCEIELEWENGFIRIRELDRLMLLQRYHMPSDEIAGLEKQIYWRYSKIVREYLYGAAYEDLDYNRIVGINLKILRKAAGFSEDEVAQRLNLSSEQYREIEAGRGDITENLHEKGTNSDLFHASRLYGVSVSELLSWGLFNHVPVEDVSAVVGKIEKLVG